MSKYKLMLMAAVCGLSVASNATLSLSHYYNAAGVMTNDLVGGAAYTGTLHGPATVADATYPGALLCVNSDGGISNGVPVQGMSLPSSLVTGLGTSWSIVAWFECTGGPQGERPVWAFTNPHPTLERGDEQNMLLLSPASNIWGSWPVHTYGQIAGGGWNEIWGLSYDNGEGGSWADTAGVLHCVVVTFDGTTMVQYCDGQYADEVDFPALDLSLISSNITVGGGSPWGVGEDAIGAYIHAFGTFDQTLSFGEVISLYALGKDATVAQVEAVEPGFEVYGSPTGLRYTHNPLVKATIVNGASTPVSALLYFDGDLVASNVSMTAGAGVTNFVSAPVYASSGFHTCRVDVVSTDTNPGIAQSHKWTFDVTPFQNLEWLPDTWNSETGSGIITGRIVDAASTIANITLAIDDVPTGAIWVDDPVSGTTGTISAAYAGFAHGTHTATMVITGNPDGLWTNTMTFWVIDEGTQATNLQYHWAFDEGAGSTITDTESSVIGNVIGANFDWTADGLHLQGQGYSDWCNAGHPSNALVGAYVDLPNGLISGLGAGAVTFEMTYKQDNSWYWSRLWDFGISAGGENVSTNDSYTPYIFGTVHRSQTGRISTEVYEGTGSGLTMNDWNHNTWDLDGKYVHLVWVYDPSAGANNFQKLYINGVLADIKTMDTPIPLSNFAGSDVNNWLGRSQWPDQMLDATLMDFRIYTGIMTAAEALARFEAEVPFVASKIPTIQSIVYAGGNATITFNSEDKATYHLLSKAALTDATWTTNSPGALSASDTTLSTQVVAGATAQFFKIEGK